MRQIELDDKVELCAHWYCRMLKIGIRKKTLTKIDALIKQFKTYSSIDFVDSKGVIIDTKASLYVVSYLETLRKRYDSLRMIHPRKFNKEIRRFEKIIPRSLVNCEMKIDGSGNFTSSLSARIINAMRYDDVRKSVYPPIARFLELKTCVYCNANFTINDKNGNGYYDLDHWKPKSLYPYLCVSFFNLQPCCPSCNRRKSSDDREYFHLWDDNNKKDKSVVGVNLTAKSIVLYKTSFNHSDLVPRFYPIKKKYYKIWNSMEDRLHIEERYKEHLDVAEEIIWKSMAYSPAMIASLRNSFKEAIPLHAEINRFILGTYDRPEDVHKRPLTVFRQNIARQLGLIK